MGLAERLQRLEHWREMDARLVAEGWHATSGWWAARLTELYASGAREAAFRVGRRGAKSSTWCRVGVADCTAGTWTIPEGDVGVWPIMSADRYQAADRVRNCVDICRALKIPHEATASVVRFPEHRTEIRVATASVKGAVSATIIGGMLDEMALWQDGNGSNPATEIVAMLMPSMLTMPDAFLAYVSAPWTTRDPHAKIYDDVRPTRYRAWAPTWVASDAPDATEAACRALAPTDAEFSRQYGARPLDAAGGFAFAPSTIARAMGIEVSS